ncbi:MAG: CHASE domain-containing protein [Kiritimatiellia bacterium]
MGRDVVESPSDILYPVRFVSPLEGHENVLGFEQTSAPRRRRAIQRAFVTASPGRHATRTDHHAFRPAGWDFDLSPRHLEHTDWCRGFDLLRRKRPVGSLVSDGRIPRHAGTCRPTLPSEPRHEARVPVCGRHHHATCHAVCCTAVVSTSALKPADGQRVAVRIWKLVRRRCSGLSGLGGCPSAASARSPLPLPAYF